MNLRRSLAIAAAPVLASVAFAWVAAGAATTGPAGAVTTGAAGEPGGARAAGTAAATATASGGSGGGGADAGDKAGDGRGERDGKADAGGGKGEGEGKVGGEREGFVALINEQLILLATIVGAIAALPTLIEFLVERRKRKERIALSLDDLEVESLRPTLAGMDDLLEDVADLIDRCRRPEAYPGLVVGNEILIIGPNLSGKKTLAMRLAKDAELDRLIIVYNPRNADALAKAKSLAHHYRRQRVMLLLPRVDLAFEQEDEDLLAELEALIETTSERSNVLVVGTAARLTPDSPLDNSFGIKLVLPGARKAAPTRPRAHADDVRRVLAQVVRFYRRQAAEAGFRLEAMDEGYLEARVLDSATNPAEIEDILSMCRTLALFERNRGARPDLAITPEMLETAVARVIVPAVPAGADAAAADGGAEAGPAEEDRERGERDDGDRDDGEDGDDDHARDA